MSDEQFIKESRQSFAILRWAPLVAVAGLPFTFAHGPISRSLFIGAALIAAAGILSLLLTWRTRNRLWSLVTFVALSFGSRWVGALDAGLPMSQFVQWLCVFIILAGAPLLLFRARLLHFARLDEPTVP